MIEPHVTQTAVMLDQFIRSGGYVHESALPMDDISVFRMINKSFIKPAFQTEIGCIYEVTDEGHAEATKVMKEIGN